MNRFLSAATVTAVGLTCKALSLTSLSVHGLENLQAALHSERRLRQQGIVTGK